MANEPRKEIIMNATMNNLTATATTSKKFAFTYNHITKKIVGTDVAFDKAGIQVLKNSIRDLFRSSTQKKPGSVRISLGKRRTSKHPGWIMAYPASWQVTAPASMRSVIYGQTE